MKYILLIVLLTVSSCSLFRPKPAPGTATPVAITDKKIAVACVEVVFECKVSTRLPTIQGAEQ